MKSKSIIVLLLYITTLTLLFLSCSESPTQTDDVFDIVGTWILTKWTLTIPPDVTVYTPEERADTMVFKSDHTYEETLILNQSVTFNDTGTWSISGSTLTTAETDGEILEREITGDVNNMTLTEAGAWGSVVEDWLKQ